MNNVKNTIGWAEFSWNPITGCLNNCHYCYARKIYHRFNKSFKPQFHYTRLLEPVKIEKPSKIFVCSVSDFWGEGVKQVWRDAVYEVIDACKCHTFMVLTKQPQNINDNDKIPKNVWVGVSYTNKNDFWRIGSLRYASNIKNKFISFEPLMEILVCSISDIDWIIIGAMSGHGNKYLPKKEWISQIMDCADLYKIPVYLKNNLIPIMGEKYVKQWQHFPKFKEIV